MSDVNVRIGEYRDHGAEVTSGYRVSVDGQYVGWTNKVPGEWVFWQDEPWLTPDELVAIGKALKEFKPRDD